MFPSRVLLPLLLAACAPTEDDGGVCDWPEEPTAPDGVVDESCGWYDLAVGDHLYVNVYLTEPESDCTATFGDGLSAPDPIYSYMSNDRPKWTYDILAQVPGLEQPVDVVCVDGSELHAKADVR